MYTCTYSLVGPTQVASVCTDRVVAEMTHDKCLLYKVEALVFLLAIRIASTSLQCPLLLRAARNQLLHHNFDAALHELRTSEHCASAARLKRSILISMGHFKQALALTAASDRVQRNRLWQLHRHKRGALALVDAAMRSNETFCEKRHRCHRYDWRWSEPTNRTMLVTARDALGGVLAVGKAAAPLRLLRAELSLHLGDWHAALADSAWLLQKKVADHDDNEARAERVRALARYATDGRAIMVYSALFRACKRAAGSAGSSAAACIPTMRWARELRCAWEQARSTPGGMGRDSCTILHKFASAQGNVTEDVLVDALNANCGHKSDLEVDPMDVFVCEPVQLPSSGHVPASADAALYSAVLLQHIMALHGIRDVPARHHDARQIQGRPAVAMPSLLVHPFRCAACRLWSEVHLSDQTFASRRHSGDVNGSASSSGVPADRAFAASATCTSCAACITAWEVIASERERAGSRLSTVERCSMAEAFLSRAWASLDQCGTGQTSNIQSSAATQYAQHAVSLGADRECKNYLGPRSHLASSTSSAKDGGDGNFGHGAAPHFQTVSTQDSTLSSSPHRPSTTLHKQSDYRSDAGRYVHDTLHNGEEGRRHEPSGEAAKNEEDEDDKEEAEWRREAAEAMAELRRAVAQQRRSEQHVHVQMTAPVAHTPSPAPTGEPTAAAVPQLELGIMLQQLRDRIDKVYRQRHASVQHEFDAVDNSSRSDQGRESSRAPTSPPPQSEPKQKRCHYIVLGVAPNATEAQIRKAFRKIALELHPDKQRVADQSMSADEAKRLFLEANEAHRVLIDPDLRYKYDLTRGVGNIGATPQESWHNAPSGDDMDAQDFRYSFRRSGVNRTGDGFVVAWATHRRTGQRHRAHFRPPATSLEAIDSALRSSVGEPGVYGARWRCATGVLMSNVGKRWRRQQQIRVDDILASLAERGMQALPASAPALECITGPEPRPRTPGEGDDEFQFDTCIQSLAVTVDAGVHNATFAFRVPACARDASNQTKLVAYLLQAGSALKAVQGMAPEVSSRSAAYWFCRSSSVVDYTKPHRDDSVTNEDDDDFNESSEYRARITVVDMPPATRFRGFHVALCAVTVVQRIDAGLCETYDPRFCTRAAPVAPFTTRDVSVTGIASGTDFLGGGWRLVRRVGPGSRWHPASDNLQGTEEYGVPASPQANETFSVRWHGEHVDEMLFSSGDGTEWLLISFAALTAFLQRRSRWPIAVTVRSSSTLRAIPYEAMWLQRPGSSEDPQVSIGLDGFEDVLLYAEAGASVELLARGHARRMGGRSDGGGNKSHGYVWTEDFLRQHNGANVWIRNVTNADRDSV